ncbi:hypothetical protein JFL43_16055 [Viridibacillus sp. YIM B01967]|uniref:Uncharacterized protein n=1 Tax=Viridibacillus soli TaxID=2798301 RepID=A0ABS1HAA5_9BACL|nr:hypothetical protein [Viridibacillus soli]MBK3496345.1 hypothetical protein [Viridibacillus soli]
MSDKYKNIAKIRVKEKELLHETKEENKNVIKEEIKKLREDCRTEYRYCVRNKDWETKIKDKETRSEYLDDILRLYYEGIKHQQTYFSKDVRVLLEIYETYIEDEIESMIENKKIIFLKGKKDNFLLTKERIKKLSDYRKAALKESKVGEEFEGFTEDFKSYEKDILRMEALGYFERENTTDKALKKYRDLIKDVRFQDGEWLSNLHYDVGEIYESMEDCYKFALISYEKAGSVLGISSDQKEEVNKKINEMLNKLEK